MSIERGAFGRLPAELALEAGAHEEGREPMRIDLLDGFRIGREIVFPRLLGDAGLEGALDSVPGQIVSPCRMASIEQRLGFLESDVSERLEVLPIHSWAILAHPRRPANCIPSLTLIVAGRGRGGFLVMLAGMVPLRPVASPLLRVGYTPVCS